ncbi:M16 family metallopeptidase [Leucothrix pacifica]|uniref:Peptidase M16 n=1 Tax=Leucothrix pacifica TaxID=1247513 RepID=A0A317C760_9GAMM|nr:M16 family metallopeptidase [Leucothrix pacifica]PWQ93253.1 hypothetical protein DKW60_18085 [Leucothrix pacifica]
MRTILYIFLLTMLVSCDSAKDETDQPLPFKKILLKVDRDIKSNEVDLRLVINRGSLSEQTNERGFAHFVEHLAFNDTAKYPNESLIPLLDKSGIALGIHTNAATYFDKTVYQLTLKEPNKEKLALALEVLSQFAMHVQFDQKVIDAEKPIVKEEWRAYQPEETSWSKQYLKSEYANSHYLNRLPIGDMAIIESAKAEDLKAFYERWYQPQHAALIVTGDIDPKQVGTLVDQYFGDWKSTEQSARTEYDVSITSIPKVSVISDPYVNGSFAAIQYYQRQSRAKSLDERYEALIVQASIDILEQRLSLRLQETKGAVGSVLTNIRFPSPNVMKTRLIANMPGGEVDTGIKFLTQAINQLLQQGITQDELDNWRDSLLKRTRLRQERSGDLALMAVRHFVYGSPLLRNADWLAALEKRLPSLTIQRINNAIRDSLQKKQARLLVVHNPSVKPPPEATLLTLLDEVVVSPSSLKVEQPKKTDQVWDINPASEGELIQTTRFDNGLIEWTFSNNTSVVFKQDSSEPDKVFYVLSDDHGMRYLNEAQSIHARLALETIGGSGLRDMNGPELEQWLNNNGISNYPYYSFWNKGVQGSAAVKDFSTAMNLLHVTLTEARVHPSARAHFLEKNKQELKQRNSSTLRPWQDKISNLLFQGDAAFRVLTEAELEGTSVSDMEVLYQQSFSGAQAYRLSVVGDISEEEALKAALASIATLPTSVLPTEKPRDFPRISKPEVATIEGSGRKAAIISHKLTLEKTALSDVSFNELSYLYLWLRSVLMAELREKEGLVYSVNVILEGGIVDQKDYSLTIEVACDPKNINTLKTRINEILHEQVTSVIESDQVEIWRKERQSQIKPAIERSEGMVTEISSAPLTGISLDKVLDVDFRSRLKDPKMLNESLAVFLSDKAIATTMIWMP